MNTFTVVPGAAEQLDAFKILKSHLSLRRDYCVGTVGIRKQKAIR